MCFEHFQTLKIMNCIFAIFHQIYRLLYANGENFIFFSHGLLFWIKLCFNKNWKTICRGGWRPHPPLQIFFHPPLQIFFHSSLGYSFKSAIILNNIRKSWNFYHTLLALLKYPFYPLFILDNGMNLISKSLTVLTPA